MSGPKQDPRVDVRPFRLNGAGPHHHDSYDAAAADSLGRPGGEPPLPVLKIVCAARLAELKVPERRWLVPDMLPLRQVTILSGDGGTGKSLLALQLAVAAVTGTDWIGRLPTTGPVLYLGAEDELDEMHRRLVDIAAARDIDLAAMGDLHLLSLAGQDAVLAVPEGRGDLIAMTPLWRALVMKIERLRPRLLVVDNSVDVFAGNEIARSQVRQFISTLQRIAMLIDCSVLLLSHPSQAGLATGSGTSGSTAWSNSVRSRLYLDRPKASSDEASDPDLRVLRTMKSNYGPIGAEIRLRWQEGVLRLDGAGAGRFDRAATEAASERVFLDLLRRITDQGRDVSHKPSANYAPAVFAKEPDNEGMTRRAFERAMSILLTRNTVRIETFGPPSRQRSRVVIV